VDEFLAHTECPRRLFPKPGPFKRRWGRCRDGRRLSNFGRSGEPKSANCYAGPRVPSCSCVLFGGAYLVDRFLGHTEAAATTTVGPHFSISLLSGHGKEALFRART